MTTTPATISTPTTSPNKNIDAPLYPAWMNREEFEKIISARIKESKTSKGLTSEYILSKYAREYYAAKTV